MKQLFIALFLIAFLSNCNTKKSRTTKYSFLREISSDINKTCPFQVDSIIKLESTSASPIATVRFTYTLKYDTVKYDIHEFEKSLRITTLNHVKTHPDAKMFKDMSATIEYNYSDTLGNFLFMIIIKPEDYKKAD